MPEYDIAKELAKLHTLSGAAYSKQVERIARKGLFHPVEGEHNIYSAIGDSSKDYESLLNAARKAVSHGYKVYIYCLIPAEPRHLILYLKERACSEYLN